jgi:hypothetical protein
LPGYIPDIKMLLNRNVNEGVSWNLPAISISFVRDWPFNLQGRLWFFVNDYLTWRGGVWFFSKKIFWFPMLLKKIFWLSRQQYDNNTN